MGTEVLQKTITPQEAENLLRKYITDERRITHCLAVGKFARQLTQEIRENRPDMVLEVTPEEMEVIGILHDIGQYGKSARGEPFLHALKGAKILEKKGLSKFAEIVLTHGTPIEAIGSEERFARLDPAKFRYPETLAEKILTYADFSTGPGGERLTLEKRIEEINKRYRGKPAAEITNRAVPRLRSLFAEIDKLRRKND